MTLNLGQVIIGEESMTIKPHVKAICFLMALTILFFANLFSPSMDIVISNINTDIFYHYIPLRSFGFSELKNGNLPLWNPHIFSGTPFTGAFISGMLYPLNLIFLLLPLSKAINLSVALHTFLVGMFMYFWASFHKFALLARITCSVILMFGIFGPHIYAGHLSQICTMTWAPLLLLSIDGWLRHTSQKWLFVGMLAVAMMVLAGFPQYTYYCSIAGVIYAGMRIFQVNKKFKLFGGIAIIFMGGMLLSSVQLFAGLNAASESVRSGKIPYAFAQSFSFPPENLITLLAPFFLGSTIDATYWGRAYLFEMTMFISFTGFILAVLALVRKELNPVRYTLAIIILIMLILALGSHTPFFRVLYRVLPGFDKFRGVSKFIYPASLFVILLSGMGFDSIIKKPIVSVYVSRLLIFLSLVIIICAWSIQQSAEKQGMDGWWYGAMKAVHMAAKAKEENFHESSDYENPQFIQKAGKRAADSLYIAACIGLLLAVLLSSSRKNDRIAWAISLLIMMEVAGFALYWRDSFRMEETRLVAIEPYLSNKIDEMSRIYNTLNYNYGMSTNNYDISGYDAMVQRRYAELFFYAAGLSPDQANMYLPVKLSPAIPSLFKMLRCQYIFLDKTDKIIVVSPKNPMKHLHLINDYQVIRSRDKIFEALSQPQFDPLKTVILESKPFFEPIEKGVGGYARVVDQSTDHLTIESKLNTPAILLITDAFHSSWRIRPIKTDSQQTYEVIPANYAFRAVPLKAGYHLFRMEYQPREFTIGLWVSLISLILYVGYLFFIIRQKLRSQRRKAKPLVQCARAKTIF